MNNKKILSTLLTLAVIIGLASALPAKADTDVSINASATIKTEGRGYGYGRAGMMKPAVFGTVSAINGTTLTVNGKIGFGKNTATTTYTVDASNAKVLKSNATSTLSSIAVGDSVFVQGTISGTNVTASIIHDGQFVMRRGPGDTDTDKTGNLPPQMQGNGQPLVAGTVSSINGSSIVITNKSNVSFTIDATGAKVLAGKTTGVLSDIHVGDSILAQGTVNGNSVTASTIIEQGKPASAQNNGKGQPGFFGRIGQFFMHMFGF